MGPRRLCDETQILAAVDATKRHVVMITYKEIDDLTQTDATALYGFLEVGPRNGLPASNGSLAARSRRFSTTNHERVDHSNSLRDSMSSSLMLFTGHPKKSETTRSRGLLPLVLHYFSEEFDVEYCKRHVQRLMSEAELSSRTNWSKYHKSDERAQEAWQEDFKKRDNLDDEYTSLTIDQMRQVLLTLIYAWFLEGERPPLPVAGA